MRRLPPVAEGQWTSPEGHTVAVEYAQKERADLCHGDVSDFGLANAVFMADRNSLDLIGFQTAAKERIRWLSVQLALAMHEARPTADLGVDAALSAWENGTADAAETIEALYDRLILYREALDGARKALIESQRTTFEVAGYSKVEIIEAMDGFVSANPALRLIDDVLSRSGH